MASVILKKAGKIQRIVYIITYIALIVYPLYKIISPAGLLPWILSLIVYIGLILVILGIIYSNPEVIVLYYIISGIIYQVSPVPGAPSSFEIMIYALLVLHIDIISKIIGTGIGYRKIRTGIQGLMASIIIPAGIIGIYVYVAYILSGFFLSLSTAMYTSNPLSSLIIGLFLRTRFGNIIFFLLI
ncbi:MAG: hypothetical protein J7K21_02435 [Desulfurococcales archaeon]|nr:hypothetical protein [Desulfurococcales archaeon]